MPKEAVTSLELVQAWQAVKRVGDELLDHAKRGTPVFNTKQFDELVQKLKKANDEYISRLTEWAKSNQI
jgi:hypothetical protein